MARLLKVERGHERQVDGAAQVDQVGSRGVVDAARAAAALLALTVVVVVALLPAGGLCVATS